MEHLAFGATGLQVPPIVFGTTSLGNLFRAPSDDEKRAIVRQWFQHVSAPVMIDSAGKYGAGLALEVLGRELAALQIPPHDVYISNKLGWRRVPLTAPEPTFEPGAWVDIEHDAVQDISRDGILRCWEEGMQLLGDYEAQLVSVHDPDEYLQAATDQEDRRRRLVDIVEAYEALLDLRDAGQVAGVGIGAKDWRVIQELDRHCEFDWVMLANSLTVLRHPPELVAFVTSLAQRNVAVVNSALFHGGFLVGGSFFDYRPMRSHDPLDQQLLQWRETFWEICKDFDEQPFDVGVAFGRSHPGVTAVALSTSRPQRCASHVAAVEREIPEDLWTALRSAELLSPDYPFL